MRRFIYALTGWSSAMLGVVAVCVAFGVPASITSASCTPAQQAILTQVENRILADLAAGETPPQIEADIANLLAGRVGVDIVVIVNEAITLLIDLGEIPPNLLPIAKNLQIVEHAKLEARKTQ